MAKITPSRGYCLIEALEADEVSAGGVYLPDGVKDMPQKGKVLAVGGLNIPDGTGIPLTSLTEYERFYPPCKVGDTVIFKKFVDNKIKEDGKELLLVPFIDILATYD